jgi:hypothetical protein
MAKFLSKINSPDYINNKIVKIDEDNNLIPSLVSIDDNLGTMTWNNGSVQQRILITDDSTANTNVFNFQQSTNSGTSFQDLMVIKDNGHVVANVFEGNLAGNANTSTQIYVNSISPATTTNYALIISDINNTGNTHLKYSNDSILNITEGTTTTDGYERLMLGNRLATGTADNKQGVLRLYSSNTGYDDIKSASHTNDLIHTLPSSSGTLLNSANYTSYTVKKDGTGASGNWGINITGSAAKLTTPRSFSITGDTVASAVNFDGSANVQLSTIRRGTLVGLSSASSNNQWFEFASISTQTPNYDAYIIFNVYSTYGSGQGILKAHLRTNSSGQYQNSEFVWLAKSSDLALDNFVLVHNTNTSPAITELWCKITTGYKAYSFDVISEGQRTNRTTNIWTLYNTYAANGEAIYTSDEGYEAEISTLTVLSNTVASAQKLQTARKINGVAFDGTKDITIDTGGSGGHTILNSSGTAMTQRSKLRFNNATVTDDATNDVTIITPSGVSGNYLPVSGGIMTGALNFDAEQSATRYLAWTFDDYAHRFAWDISSTGALNSFMIQSSPTRTSPSSFYNLLEVTKDGNVKANTFTGALSGNATTATTLQTARTINGTSFNGSANITTANWGTARNIGIVNSDGTGTAVTTSVNGSGNVNLKLPATIKATLDGNATTASTLANARTINGTSFNGSANITTANWGTARTITIGNTGKSVNGSANISWSLSEIGAAASSHTHNTYLPLAGGAMTGTISSSKTTQTYLAGSQGVAVINSTAASGSYTTLLKANSTNGKFTFNVYQGNMLLGYMTDDAIEAGTNSLTKSWYFAEDGTFRPGINNSQNLGTSSAKWLAVYATTFNGALSGNATTATRLQTARTIAISGGVTGTATSFNGTANITIPVTAVDASKLTNKNTIKTSEINNDKHWIPSNDNSVTNIVAMTTSEYNNSSSALPNGSFVAITDASDAQVTTVATSITCDLPLDL